MRPWRASLLHSKQSRFMRPSSARAPRRGLRCSSTSRYFTIGSACTQPWATEPRPRLAPAWRGSPCPRRHDILISPLHTKGGGPVEKVLVPGLRRGDVGILDNLSSHKGARVRALIEAAG